MENLPFDTTNIDQSDIQSLKDIYENLKNGYTISLVKDSQILLSEFDVFRNSPDAYIGGTLLINHPENGCYLNFVKIQTILENGRGPSISYFKYQIWASATLRNNFGRVIIRRKTLVDKILNVLHPVELHFNDDSSFTNSFFVVANDENKAISALTKNFRNVVSKIQLDDFTLEIVNNKLIIGNNRIITPQQALYLAELTTKLSVVR